MVAAQVLETCEKFRKGSSPFSRISSQIRYSMCFFVNTIKKARHRFCFSLMSLSIFLLLEGNFFINVIFLNIISFYYQCFTLFNFFKILSISSFPIVIFIWYPTFFFDLFYYIYYKKVIDILIKSFYFFSKKNISLLCKILDSILYKYKVSWFLIKKLKKIYYFNKKWFQFFFLKLITKIFTFCLSYLVGCRILNYILEYDEQKENITNKLFYLFIPKFLSPNFFKYDLSLSKIFTCYIFFIFITIYRKYEYAPSFLKYNVLITSAPLILFYLVCETIQCLYDDEATTFADIEKEEAYIASALYVLVFIMFFCYLFLSFLEELKKTSFKNKNGFKKSCQFWSKNTKRLRKIAT